MAEVSDQRVAVPDRLAKMAREKEWPLDKLERMLQLFSPFQVQILLDRNMTAEQAERLLAGERPDENAPLYTPAQEEYIDKLNAGQYDLRWLQDQEPSWGVRSSLSSRGLDHDGYQQGVRRRSGRCSTHGQYGATRSFA